MTQSVRWLANTYAITDAAQLSSSVVIDSPLVRWLITGDAVVITDGFTHVVPAAALLQDQR